ncbi:hypothetical protein CY652_13445 [Burkholderia sp. WAC0059]|nr:hypothetical protein CY652_13445 [Burkholderia sp. WAC0059]
MAQVHRMSYLAERENLNEFVSGNDTEKDFRRWTDRFVRLAQQRANAIGKNDQFADDEKQRLLELIETGLQAYLTTREALIADRKNSGHQEAFLRELNSVTSNAKDLGPHEGVNSPVGALTHLNTLPNPEESPDPVERPLTPTSRELVRSMSTGRLTEIATTNNGTEIITTRGLSVPIAELSVKDQEAIRRHGTKDVAKYDPERGWPEKSRLSD